MDFPEKVLEDWLFENPSAYFTDGHTFKWIGRQVRVASGIIDLIGVEVKTRHQSTELNHTLHIVELKAEPIKSRHLTQVCRYTQDIEFGCDSIGLCCGIIKAVVGTDVSSNVIQFEADALGIHLHEVSPSFQISGPWGFKSEACEKHEQINIIECEKIACSILEMHIPSAPKQLVEALSDG